MIPDYTIIILHYIPGSGNKGLVDLLLFKRDLMHHLIENFIDKHNLGDLLKTAARKLDTPSKYRRNYSTASDDLTWVGELPQVHQDFLQLLEDCDRYALTMSCPC
jgi:hypothetical protein